MKTFEAIRGHEEMLLSYFNLPPITGNKHYRGECPLCGKREQFRLNYRNENLCWICKCGSGGLLQLICDVTGRVYSDIAQEVDRLVGRKPDAEDRKPPASEGFLQKFFGLPQVYDSPVQAYLNGRGIYNLPMDSIRFSPGEFDQEYGRAYATMYAMAVDDAGKPCYCHKTYLEDGQKANVPKPKKVVTIRQTQGSIAIRMFPMGSTLGISEGIETGLAANQLYDLPVWATLNTAFMKRFKAPKTVEHLIIFADHDRNGAGFAAAFECAHKNLLSNNDVRRVSIRWTAKPGDFNDALAGGHEVKQMQLGDP